MSTFDERGNAQETKYVMDAGLEFKAEAKRNKTLGLWAAGLLGRSEEAGDDDVFRKLRADLSAGNCDVSDQAIRDKMADALAAARAEVYGS